MKVWNNDFLNDKKYDKWDWLRFYYSDQERQVINRSSIFNGIKANPWITENEIVNILDEKLYEDPDGFPSLSASQKHKCVGFKRPRDFIPKKFK